MNIVVLHLNNEPIQTILVISGTTAAIRPGAPKKASAPKRFGYDKLMSRFHVEVLIVRVASFENSAVSLNSPGQLGACAPYRQRVILY